MPVDQKSGIHIDLPQLVNVLPFDTVKDYEDYITRLTLFPRLFDQTITQMRKGMADGLMRALLHLARNRSQRTAMRMETISMRMRRRMSRTSIVRIMLL